MAMSVDDLRVLADSILPPDLAARWSSMLRPAVRLGTAATGDRVAARLGGFPRLPLGSAWPTWEGVGPLSFVGFLDCEVLAGLLPDLGLPEDGQLLLFYFDGSFNDFDATVGYWDPTTAQGAQLLYVSSSLPTVETTCPDGLNEFPALALAGRVVGTYPTSEHPALADLYERARGPLDPLYEALYERESSDRSPRHQVGGHANCVQGPVEMEVAAGTSLRATGIEPSWADAALLHDAVTNWILVAQIDSDDRADMMWGDVGTLYYLMRPDDLRARRFDAAGFTWQCS
jgi:uncharacterized protein YwqG